MLVTKHDRLTKRLDQPPTVNEIWLQHILRQKAHQSYLEQVPYSKLYDRLPNPDVQLPKLFGKVFDVGNWLCVSLNFDGGCHIVDNNCLLCLLIAYLSG